MNHLRQLAAAAASFHSTHNRYPAVIIRSGSGRSYEPRSISVHAQLLPYVEARTLFDRVDLTEDGAGQTFEPTTSSLNSELLRAPVGVFGCPSDDAPPGGVSYRGCAGTSPRFFTTSPETDSGAAKAGFFTVSPRRDAEVVDGLSQTVMFSERLIGDRDAERYTPARDLFLAGGGGFLYPDDAASGCELATGVVPNHLSYSGTAWLFGSHLHTVYNHVRTPNARGADCFDGIAAHDVGQGAVTARSWHGQGVHAAFGDGSTRFVSETIDLEVWRALGSIAGREVTSGGF